MIDTALSFNSTFQEPTYIYQDATQDSAEILNLTWTYTGTTDFTDAPDSGYTQNVYLDQVSADSIRDEVVSGLTQPELVVNAPAGRPTDGQPGGNTTAVTRPYSTWDVPEPGTLALLALGVLELPATRRRAA